MKSKSILFVVLVVVSLLSSCGPAMKLSQAFTIEEMKPDFPNGLIAKEMIGHNWFKGTYDNRPVLIHFVKTYGSVNVEFQFVDREE